MQVAEVNAPGLGGGVIGRHLVIWKLWKEVDEVTVEVAHSQSM